MTLSNDRPLLISFTTDLPYVRPACPSLPLRRFLGANDFPLTTLNPRPPRRFLDLLSLDSASPLVSCLAILDRKYAALVLAGTLFARRGEATFRSVEQILIVDRLNTRKSGGEGRGI